MSLIPEKDFAVEKVEENLKTKPLAIVIHAFPQNNLVSYKVLLQCGNSRINGSIEHLANNNEYELKLNHINDSIKLKLDDSVILVAQKDHANSFSTYPNLNLSRFIKISKTIIQEVEHTYSVKIDRPVVVTIHVGKKEIELWVKNDEALI